MHYTMLSNCLYNTCTNWYCPASQILHGPFWPFLLPRFTGRPVTIISHNAVLLARRKKKNVCAKGGLNQKIKGGLNLGREQ